MGYSTRYTCSHCAYAVNTGSDPALYVTDKKGKRRYFFHPGGDQEMWDYYNQHPDTPFSWERPRDMTAYHAFMKEHLRGENHYLCLNCLAEMRRDREHDPMLCTACGSDELLIAWDLKNRTCPRCKEGTMVGELSGIS